MVILGNQRSSVYINFEAAPNAQKFVDGSRLNQKQKKKYFEDIRFEILSGIKMDGRAKVDGPKINGADIRGYLVKYRGKTDYACNFG